MFERQRTLSQGSGNAGHGGRSHAFRLVAQAWQTPPFLCSMRARLVQCFNACLRDHVRLALTQPAPPDAAGPHPFPASLHKPVFDDPIYRAATVESAAGKAQRQQVLSRYFGLAIEQGQAIRETRYAGSDGAASQQRARERSFCGSKVQVIPSREKYGHHRLR